MYVIAVDGDKSKHNSTGNESAEVQNIQNVTYTYIATFWSAAYSCVLGEHTGEWSAK